MKLQIGKKEVVGVVAENAQAGAELGQAQLKPGLDFT